MRYHDEASSVEVYCRCSTTLVKKYLFKSKKGFFGHFVNGRHVMKISIFCIGVFAML
jgi:hypothetical protein